MSWKCALKSYADHMTLELLHFLKTGHVGSAGRHPMNELGFTHIAVWVSDLDAAAERVQDYGGAIVQSALLPGVPLPPGLQRRRAEPGYCNSQISSPSENCWTRR